MEHLQLGFRDDEGRYLCQRCGQPIEKGEEWTLLDVMTEHRRYHARCTEWYLGRALERTAKNRHGEGVETS